MQLALLLGSCRQQDSNTHHAATLRLNLSDDPSSLDPREVRRLKDLTVVKQLFEGLMRMDANGIPQFAIAQQVETSQDLFTYTFFLREAYWTNGEQVTAHDFEYAWKKVLDPTFASDYAYMLYPIKNAKLAREGKCSIDEVGIKALDDHKLLVQLELPTPYFLELMAFPTYFPVNKNHIPSGDKLVSNGPFQLDSWHAQSDLSLRKNPSYWDAEAVHLDRIVFTIISDNQTECVLFEKEELDWLGQPVSHNISKETLEKMKEEGRASSYPIAGTFWLKFNTNKAPFDSLKIRQAFAYALNRQEIIEHILQGDQVAATGPLPPSMLLNQGPYFQDGNTRLAKQLFEEVLIENGWTLASFPAIILHCPPKERDTKIVQLVQEQWKKTFGIDVCLETVEDQLYQRNVKLGLFQVGTGQWIADFNDPLAFLELFKHADNGINDTGWSDPEYTSLLDLSLRETDLEKRRALLHLAEMRLVEGMPIIPLYHYAFDYAKKGYVEDVFLSPLGIADFKQARINTP